MSIVQRFLIIPAAMFLLFVLACGGSDENNADNPTSAPDSVSGNSATATTELSSSSGIPVDAAVVSIENKKYEFSMGQVFGFDRCVTAFGVIAGTGEASDGTDLEIEFEIPPVGYENKQGFEDFDPPSVEVKDNENSQQWMAGGNFDWLQDPPGPGESQVDSYTSNGTVASGTATFLEMNAYRDFVFGFGDQPTRPEPMTGTFEIRCNS